MLNWTEADKPYVEALVALEAVSWELLALQLREDRFLGSSVWLGLMTATTNVRLAWTNNRLVRLRADMAIRRA